MKAMPKSVRQEIVIDVPPEHVFVESGPLSDHAPDVAATTAGRAGHGAVSGRGGPANTELSHAVA